MTWLSIIIGIVCIAVVIAFIYHQRKLSIRAHLMQEAIRNHDFTFRLPTQGMFSGERAMQEALNQLGQTVSEQVNRNEVESWERLTRVLTHEMMNATAPITSISQSLLNRGDVKGTSLEDGIKAICDTSKHLSEFVVNYRKMSELEKPVLTDVVLYKMVEDVSKSYPQLLWEIQIPKDLKVKADVGMLRQVFMNLTKNAIEADAHKMAIALKEETEKELSTSNQVDLYIGNDGLPIPAENRQSLFIPFFTTKHSGSGIGLSLSRRIMIQQGGMLELSEKPFQSYHTTFVITVCSSLV